MGFRGPVHFGSPPAPGIWSGVPIREARRSEPVNATELKIELERPEAPGFGAIFLNVILHCSVSPAYTAVDLGNDTETRMSLMAGSVELYVWMRGWLLV